MKNKNLKIFSESKNFIELLRSFNVIEKGRFEYKGLSDDGRHMQGEYFVNFRLLKTPQELELVPYYHKAIKEFFGDKVKEMIIVGVAYGSLSLPKIIQTLGFDKFGIEYAYAEKRDGLLGIFDAQVDKCKGKHLLFIEDVCNNGISGRQLVEAIKFKTEELKLKGYSIIYGVHRGHNFLEKPKGEVYAMSVIYAPSYHHNEIPESLKEIPLKEYKK